MSDILVTVICLTYNHEKYIRKALDGFVMQKTTFPFEVIVHDDASTDGTVEIIKEYEKYDCIVPIYEKENQYSQKKSLRPMIIPHIRGKYVAFCEGDDFWTDENKLQILTDYMVRNPDCSMCCHSFYRIEANTEKVLSEEKMLDSEGDISVEQAISYKNRPQLASQIFRPDVVLNLTDIFTGYEASDYPLLLYAANAGRLHYIDKTMACHRVAADGSWTVRIGRVPEKKAGLYGDRISFLADFNAYTGYKYKDAVEEKIRMFKNLKARLLYDYKEQFKYGFWKRCGMKRRLLILFGIVFPEFAKRIEKKFTE